MGQRVSGSSKFDTEKIKRKNPSSKGLMPGTKASDVLSDTFSLCCYLNSNEPDRQEISENAATHQQCLLLPL